MRFCASRARMGMLLTFDFHNHSCLSPCAQLENSPRNMVARAQARHIDFFAVTDHNCALNAPAFAIASGRACARARRYARESAPANRAIGASVAETASGTPGLIPLFGLELSPFEEAHLLALFPDPLAALAFSDFAQGYLPKLAVDPSRFGDQVAIDPEDAILSMPSAWFGNPLQESFGFFAKAAAEAGALVIPAHVDRALFSVYSQLGFLPEGPYDAVEAVGRNPDATLRLDYRVISGSDAHVLEHIGRRSSTLELEDSALDRARLNSLREGLARMAEAWDTSSGDSVDAGEPGGEEEPSICAESVSSNIPDMARLVDFLARWYPREESSAVFAAIRRALRSGRAWSVHERPRVV